MLQLLRRLPLVLLVSSVAHAQTVVQSGSWSAGHVPVYLGPPGPYVGDSGPAGGQASKAIINEFAMVVPSAPGQSAPWASSGTGPFTTNWCDYDAPIANATGGHYLCFSPNANGGGLIAYGPFGTASPLPLNFDINGTITNIGGSVSSITVGSTTVGSGTNGAVLYDNAGVLGNLPLGSGVAAMLAIAPGTTNGPVQDGGTPAGLVLTNATGLPISTGVSGLGSGVAAMLAIAPGTTNGPVKDGGTPAGLVLTNATGLPVSTGISGLGTGIATALAINKGSSGAPVVSSAAGNTVSSPMQVGASLPTISSCGGGTPAIAAGGSSNAGQVTFGTGSPTACTLTFLTPFTNYAYCTVTPASSNAAAISGGYYISTQSKTAFTLTLGTGTSSAVFNYTCGGN